MSWICARYLDDRPAEDRGNEPPADTPVDALARLALAGGTLLGRPFTPREHAGEDLDRKEPRFSGPHNGFDGHGDVRLAAGDDAGRERLIRYCARPSFALERIEEMKDGRISYLMKTPRRGSTHRVMTPVDAGGIPGPSRDPRAPTLRRVRPAGGFGGAGGQGSPMNNWTRALSSWTPRGCALSSNWTSRGGDPRRRRGGTRGA